VARGLRPGADDFRGGDGAARWFRMITVLAGFFAMPLF